MILEESLKPKALTLMSLCICIVRSKALLCMCHICLFAHVMAEMLNCFSCFDHTSLYLYCPLVMLSVYCYLLLAADNEGVKNVLELATNSKYTVAS